MRQGAHPGGAGACGLPLPAAQHHRAAQGLPEGLLPNGPTEGGAAGRGTEGGEPGDREQYRWVDAEKELLYKVAAGLQSLRAK